MAVKGLNSVANIFLFFLGPRRKNAGFTRCCCPSLCLFVCRPKSDGLRGSPCVPEQPLPRVSQMFPPPCKTAPAKFMPAAGAYSWRP